MTTIETDTNTLSECVIRIFDKYKERNEKEFKINIAKKDNVSKYSIKIFSEILYDMKQDLGLSFKVEFK